MKYIGIAFLSIVTITVFGQEEKTVESKITSVTVFLNRAQVTREAKTRVDAGKSILRLKGLTSQLDQQSIQVAGKGNFTILGISHEQNYLTELNLPRQLASLRDSIELTQRQIALQNSQKEILNREEQMLLANQKIGGTNQNLTAAELKGMADFFRTRLADIIQARMKHDQTIKKLNEKLAKLQRQFNEENDLYARNTSAILISVSAEAATNADLAINYVVNNAGWFAVYDLRTLNTKSPVQLNYKANVYQSTGEEWKNVRLKLSTANPSLGGLKPELANWYLNFYQPPYQLQGRAPGVAMRKSEMPQMQREVASEEDASEVAPAPAETTSQYVTTIQTSLNTEFDISLPYTVSSSNKPTLVEIRNYELKADYNYASAPKLDNDAFLIARATGWEDFSLLPGEANVFFEGTFVGKSYIDPNSIKDTLNVSLGRDKRIVVKREKMKDFSSRKLIGSNQRETRAFEISVRNTKTELVKITLEDQVPISQNSQIEVTVSDVGGARYNKDNGKLIWELTLQPNETKKVVYKYEVKYPKDRVVAGLE
ncbi:MAG TPA: DUF4139 domain-containing protein [Chryseosolibacter sp.]